jgi:hypothetical protein
VVNKIFRSGSLAPIPADHPAFPAGREDFPGAGDAAVPRRPREIGGNPAETSGGDGRSTSGTDIAFRYRVSTYRHPA